MDRSALTQTRQDLFAHLHAYMTINLSLSRAVRVYISIIGANFKHPRDCHGHLVTSTMDLVDHDALQVDTEGEMPSDPDAGVVTRERMLRGLELLRKKKAAKSGLFYDSFTAEELAQRPLYPFLPRSVDALLSIEPDPDAPEGIRAVSMYCTNVELPVPIEFQNASPPSLYHAIIAWLYSIYFPTEMVGRCRLHEFCEDEEFDMYVDLDRPLDLLKEYPDEWIMRKITTEIVDTIEVSMQDTPLEGFVRFFPWAIPGSTPPTWGTYETVVQRSMPQSQ